MKFVISPKFIFDFLVVFLYLFPMTPTWMHGLTTRITSAMIAIFVLLIKREKVKQVVKSMNIKHLRTSLLCLCSCFFLLLITNAINVSSYPDNLIFKLSYFLYIIVFVIVFSFFCLIEFDTAIDFLKVYGAIFIVQFVAVMSAVVSTEVRLLLYNLFYYGDDRFEKSIVWGTRIMGIALHSATGSVTCATGAVLVAYIFLKRQIGLSLFLFLYGLVFLTTMFIGRTGTIVEAFIFLYTVMMGGRNLFKRVIPITFFGLLLTYTLTEVMSKNDSGSAETVMKWITSPLDTESRMNSMSGINRHLPEFSSEFIFGTGVMRGHTPGQAYVESDSGYVMIISSLGIIGAILFYFSYFSLFTSSRLKTMKPSIKYYFLLIIICVYVIEYKEPFMLKHTFPFMLVYLAFYERVMTQSTKKQLITNVTRR